MTWTRSVIRSPSRYRRYLGATFVSIVSLPILVGLLVGPAPSHGSNSPAAGIPPCALLSTVYPGVGNNSTSTTPFIPPGATGEIPVPNATDGEVVTLFRAVCQLPSFISAAGQYSVGQFSLGASISGRSNLTTVYFGFNYIAACTNATYGIGNPCSTNEYWSGDPQTGAVSGPAFSQLPEATSRPPLSSTPGFSGESLVALMLAASVIGLAGALYLLLHRRARRL